MHEALSLVELPYGGGLFQHLFNLTPRKMIQFLEKISEFLRVQRWISRLRLGVYFWGGPHDLSRDC